MRLSSFLLCSVVLLLSSCASPGRQNNSMIMTQDGRLVTETAEVARDEFAKRAATHAGEAAGPGWTAQVAIDVLPTLHAVQADEFGWQNLPIALTLIPPAGSPADPAARERAIASVRDFARYRVQRSTAVTITTAVLDAGTPPPGSTSYTSVAGDTLAGIAQAFYGSAQPWRLIADANPRLPAGALPAGTVLVIPPKP